VSGIALENIIKGAPKAPAFTVNFAMVPKIALNSAELLFEPTAAAANAMVARYQKAKLKQLRGSGLRVADAAVRRTYETKNNVIILWTSIDFGASKPPAGHDAAAKLIRSCIAG
jgi:hypothetical protein